MSRYSQYPWCRHCARGRLLLLLPLLLLLLTVRGSGREPLGKEGVHAYGEKLLEGWRWTTFTIEHGLPSSEVYAMTRTRDNTVWAATHRGIAWFDGYQWHTVLTYADVAEPQKSIRIFSDGSDSVLALIGLDWYYGNRDGMTRLPVSGHEAIPVGPQQILIRVDSSLRLYDHGTLRAVPTTSIGSLLSVYAPFFYKTRSGTVWLRSTRGLFYWDGRAVQPKFVPPSENFLVTALTEDEDGHGYAAAAGPSPHQGLWEWKGFGMPVRIPFERGNYLRDIDFWQSADLLCLSRAGEVIERRGGTWQWLQKLPAPLQATTFLTYDRMGNLWVGSRQGLSLFRASSERWRVHKYPPPRKNRIYEIFPASDGTIWIGGEDGLERYTPGAGSRLIDRVNGIPIRNITGINEDRRGHIWISSGQAFNGAWRWDGTRWSHERIDASQPFLRVHKIRRDREGGLWFLGLGAPANAPDQPGAYRYDGTMFTRWSEREGLPSGRVYAFDQASDGAYWFGTAKGLCRWYQGNIFRYPEVARYLQEKVFTLAVDTGDGVWLSDEDRGIVHLDRSGTMEAFSIDDGLPANAVWEIRTAADGIIWCTTEQGAAYYAHGAWNLFDPEHEGMPGLALWPIVPAGDTLYVGTIGGGWVECRLNAFPRTPPRVVLTDPVSGANHATLQWRIFGFWGEPRGEEVRSRYRINNGRWSPWSTGREASVGELAPGTYVYSVQIGNFLGGSDMPATTGYFSIPQPFYLRSEFLAPLGLLLLAIIVLGVVHMIRMQAALRDRLSYQRNLQLLVRELSRTEERERRQFAGYLHDQVSQTLGFCKMKLGALRQPYADTDLEDVQAMIGRLYSHVRSYTLSLSPPVLHELGLAEAIHWLTRQLQTEHRLEFRFSRDGDCSQIDREASVILFHIVQELCINVVKHAHARTVTVALAHEPGRCRITVADDGVGYEASRGAANDTETGGFGIFNIRERLVHLGGTITYASAPGQGTTVVVAIPIPLSQNQHGNIA